MYPCGPGTIQKKGGNNVVVGTGPDIVCLAAGVLLWRDRLRAGLQIHRFIVRGFES